MECSRILAALCTSMTSRAHIGAAVIGPIRQVSTMFRIEWSRLFVTCGISRLSRKSLCHLSGHMPFSLSNNVDRPTSNGINESWMWVQ